MRLSTFLRARAKTSVGAALVGALAAATLAGPAHADPPPGSTAPSGYQLVFSDDFDGTALDTVNWGMRQRSWVSDDNVKVAGGVLSLDQTRVTTANDESGFRGAGIATKKHFGYGYYEARIKLTPNDGPFHQSFWTQIWDGQYAKPDYAAAFTELDFFESYKGGTHGGYFTWQSGEEDQWQSSSARVAMGDPSGTEYATYGALYEPGKLTFFLNGTQMGSLTYDSVPNSPMAIWLSTIPEAEKVRDLKDPVGHSYGTMDVDWVRYYTSDGNVPATVPASVPASLINYSNDFESGSAANWTTSGGSWAVGSDGSNRVYRQTSATGDTFSLYTATPTHFPMWKNTTVSAAIKLSSDGNGAGLLARYTNPSNYYYLRLNASTDTVDLVKRHNGVVTTLASHSTTVTPGTTYQLSLKANDGRLTAKLNGTQVINVTDQAMRNGKWGVKAYNQPFSVDSVTMTSP
ncbi:family 16 glycosylhydrolase [Streptomyces sp. NPDC008343]|uniref:glycoside hydrolase family 16 protein n=1 Tax=Streptomyces sp. NPDC008343 TaxID=3364828 RepID=UPI0036E7CAF5